VWVEVKGRRMFRLARTVAFTVVVSTGCTTAPTDTTGSVSTLPPPATLTVTTQAPTTAAGSTTLAPSTTTTAPTTTTTTSTTTKTQPEARHEAIVLAADGLGVVSFGDPVEEVMAILVDLFGPPSYDRHEESPFESEDWTGPDRGPSACHVATVPIFGGHICFDYIRVVWWEDDGLLVSFSDLVIDNDDYVEVPPGLRGYVYGGGTGPPARTADGIAVGSTVRELQNLGDRVTYFGPGCGDNIEFSISDPDSTDGGTIHGVLVGTDPEAFHESGYVNPDATIRWLTAGAQRSC